MKKLALIFCLLFSVSFAQVPNTTTFTLQDVVNNVAGASGNLSSCFSNAVSGKFDPAYNQDSYAPANSMLRFRNYGLFHHIGDSYQGGIIFKINSDGSHGQITSTSDQSTGVRWHNGSYILVGTNYTDGLTNTNSIITAQGTGSYAAKIARDYTGGGYTDWYLPTSDDLFYIYTNLIPLGLGGFGNVYYWSSTETEYSEQTNANVMDLATSSQAALIKSNAGPSVRAIRSF